MRRLELVSDCGSCAGLCCELTVFEASEDFAFDKAAGERCRHLDAAHSCEIHRERAQRGMRGCAVYECYGAGPVATQLLAAEALAVRVEGFRVLRVLGELAWLLSAALAFYGERLLGLRREMEAELARVRELGAAELDGLLACDVSAVDRRVRALLRRVGDVVGRTS